MIKTETYCDLENLAGTAFVLALLSAIGVLQYSFFVQALQEKEKLFAQNS
ncbi:hypothetical protein VCHA37P203_150128 [Vibrio chagasii]|nr:hypothetical protein VCHA37P203_150128 [Vibrio chagasii]